MSTRNTAFDTAASTQEETLETTTADTAETADDDTRLIPLQPRHGPQPKRRQ